MSLVDHAGSSKVTADAPPTEPLDEVVAFLAGRSAPCPRCGYDLRDIQSPRCPECGEPLVLRIGSPRARFGWLVVAMAPGCFSGVAATLLAFPIYRTIGLPPGRGVPWPIMVAEAFGIASAASVGAMYLARHRIMSWTGQRQMVFALGVWGAHVLVFVLTILAMIYLK
jgi:hypothetical protein